MTLSQTYRTALIAVAGFLLTAVFHAEAVAQANSARGVRNTVIVHGASAAQPKAVADLIEQATAKAGSR